MVNRKEYPVIDRDESEVENFLSQEPSGLVERLDLFLPKNARILDLDCGNGRNAIYLASLGYHVDATDSEPKYFLSGIKGVKKEVRDRIRFKRALRFNESFDGKYDAILMMNILHYYSHGLINKLFKLVYEHTTPRGLLVASTPITPGIAGPIFRKRIDSLSLPPDRFEEMLQRNNFDHSIVFEVVQFVDRKHPGIQYTHYCQIIAGKKV